MPAHIELPDPVSSDTALLLAFTRLESKVDVALTQHGADLKAQSKDIEDHEARIRVLEDRPRFNPKLLWSGLLGATTVILALPPFLDRIFH